MSDHHMAGDQKAPSDRFDFEQQIIRCWCIVEDLKELDEGLFNGWVDGDEYTVSNHVQSLAHTYNLKFNKLWSLFEDVMMAEVRKNRMLEEECAAMRKQLAEKQKGKK
jgi:hypothetical protein